MPIDHRVGQTLRGRNHDRQIEGSGQQIGGEFGPVCLFEKYTDSGVAVTETCEQIRYPPGAHRERETETYCAAVRVRVAHDRLDDGGKLA